MYSQILDVQFSGNAAVYNYGLTPVDGDPVPGQRVVVPTKMKTDGTVTLTIATVVGVRPLGDTAQETLKPIISLLSKQAIDWATREVFRLEGATA
jgi:hypothetical protein